MKQSSGIVLVVSSHVVRGSVGNRAVAFALESLGHPVWTLPTVILPWHPGHGKATRHALPDVQFRAIIDDLAGSRWVSEISAVLTGYFASAGQVRAAADLVRALLGENRSIPYLCDPVIGDVGGLYVEKETAAAIRDELIPLASIATPNRFELGWLAGAPIDDNDRIMDAALALGPERVLTTSAVPMLSGGIGNLLLSAQEALLAEHRAIPNPPNGLGDLLSATFLSRLLNGASDERALQTATATVYDMLARTVRRQSDELTLASDRDCFLHPGALVQVRRLVHPARRRGG